MTDYSIHERERWGYMNSRQLTTRLSRITSRPKLAAFIEMAYTVASRRNLHMAVASPSAAINLLQIAAGRANALGFTTEESRANRYVQELRNPAEAEIPTETLRRRMDTFLLALPGMTITGLRRVIENRAVVRLEIGSIYESIREMVDQPERTTRSYTLSQAANFLYDLETRASARGFLDYIQPIRDLRNRIYDYIARAEEAANPRIDYTSQTVIPRLQKQRHELSTVRVIKFRKKDKK